MLRHIFEYSKHPAWDAEAYAGVEPAPPPPVVQVEGGI